MSKRDVVHGLPELLKAAREKAGMSQNDAEQASGVPRVNVSAFENGAKTPTVATLIKLAAAYGIDAGELIPRPLPETEPAAEAPPPAEKKKPKKK